MVHPQVQPVLALGLAALERAKSQLVHRLYCHSAALSLLIAAALAATFLHGKASESAVFAGESIAAGLAALSELLALYYHHKGLEAHSQGRQVMRRVMLLDARRPEDAEEYLAYIRPELPRSVRAAADTLIADDPKEGTTQHQLRRYYASDRTPGRERLRDHLLESAMFSERLYRSGWEFSVRVLAAFLIGTAIVIALMIARGFGPGVHWAQFGIRLLIAILAFIPASQEVDHAFLYRMMSHDLKGLIARIERLWDPSIPGDQLELRLTGDVGDYGANTTFAPPIRKFVYNRLDPHLNKIVVDRLAELEKQASPVASPPRG